MNISIDQISSLRTPFYHYDTQLLRTTLAALHTACNGDIQLHPHYAIKANANPSLLRIVAAEGLGADCVSAGEIRAAVEAGFAPQTIVFAGVGKTDEEIDAALAAGIGCFNVESLPELEAISQRAAALGTKATIALRINPDIDAHTHEKITTGRSENKFGIHMADMLTVVKSALQSPHLDYAGLHFHIGSNILDLNVFKRLALRINELQRRLETDGISTRTINIGGGLGVDYANPDAHPVPDFQGYADTFRQHLELRPRQVLHCEPGRAVMAQCGTLISRVVYVKQGFDRKFLILDAGFTDLLRPALYNAHHLIENLTSRSQETETYDVVGPICESSDVFQVGAKLPRSSRGDYIALRSAGAYGETMASQYNLRPLPGTLIF